MKHIVIYEDDHLTRTLLRERLSEAGYCVHLNAPLLAPLDEAGPKWTADLLIVSVYMPKRSGLLCIRDIKQAHPGAPLIAISGQFRSGLSAAGATAEGLGVQQVIAKPLVLRDLLAAVRCIIGGPK
jgi:DNA-binding response OmpR family regulator